MRIAVLAGGPSLEREVSLQSGQRVHRALGARGHDAAVVDPSEPGFAERLSGGGFDACYVALHGKHGEDGTVQRLLELLGLPYTGTGPAACARAFDKALAKDALAEAGIATPAWTVLSADGLRDLGAGGVLHLVVERLGIPLVVKPSRGGSALGVRFVDREGDLASALMGALSFDDRVVIEQRIEGKEVAVGFLGEEILPAVEIAPKEGIYDYAARYTTGATEYFVPARLDQNVEVASRDTADQAFRALAVRGVGRADLMVDAHGRPWVLEVNVSPGMTDTSLLPMAAQAAGLSFEDLCDRIIRLSLP